MPVRKRLNWLIQRGTIGTPTSRSMCIRDRSHRACRPAYEVTISNLDVAAGSRSCTALTSPLISSTAVCTSRLNPLTTVLTGAQPRACLPRNQQPAMPRLAMPSSLRNTTVTFLSRLRRPRAAARPSATLSRGGAGARGAAGGGPLPRRFGGRRFVHTARAKPLQIEGHIREPEAARLERAPEVVALHLDAGDAPVVPHAAPRERRPRRGGERRPRARARGARPRVHVCDPRSGGVSLGQYERSAGRRSAGEGGRLRRPRERRRRRVIA